MKRYDVDFDNDVILLYRSKVSQLERSSVKTKERAYAAFVQNERFKRTIDLLDEPKQPELTVVK